ncbi:MAG: hypothetical protein JW828_14365 [Sedimentisphaerales bacterium]|nr:hypothetical protein [Sedimentisphaerales bacterium]
MRRLIDALGFTDFHFQGIVKGNGDELWVTKGIRDREKPYDEVLILSATKPPLVKKIFHNTIYNDFGREIGTTYEDQNKQKHVQFKNGKELIAPGPFRLDTMGSYLCMGGGRCRPPQGDMRYEPIRVYSLDSLDNPMYFSSLTKYPDEMLYIDGTIILISKSQSPSAGLEVECAQKQNDNRWIIMDHYVIRPPAIYAVDFMQMRKFDPATRNMVVFVKQDWPLNGKVYFYDYHQKKLIRGSFLNQQALYFLNATVLSNSVKYMVQK